MGNIVEIYSLNCPISKEVRYIGKANNSEKRLKSHIRDSKSRNTPVYAWIRELLSKGLMPEMNVILVCDNGTWQSKEIELINQYQSLGTLLNVAKGGKEPFCSKEQRAINGKSVAKEIHSNPNKRKLWELKHMLGQSMRYLKKHGMIDDYNRISLKLTSGGFAHSYGTL